MKESDRRKRLKVAEIEITTIVWLIAETITYVVYIIEKIKGNAGDNVLTNKLKWDKIMNILMKADQ